MWNVLVYLTLLTICCSYALGKGGAPERIGAAIILIAVALSALVASSYRGAFAQREMGIFLVDVAMFGAATALALRAERLWPLCLAALLGLGLELQILSWMAPHRQVYKVLHALNAYPVLLVLAVGTWRHQRRLTLGGVDRNWSCFSSR